MKNAFIISVIIAFVLVACQDDSLKIIHHKKPALQTDFSPFQNSGNQGLMSEIGCNRIEKEDLLGGLSPMYPVARCNYFVDQEGGARLSATECFSSDIRMNGASCSRLVTFKDGNYLLIKTVDELRHLFAPVDSPEEALSFVVANSDYSAKYGQTQQDNYIYDVKKLEDTHVKRVSDGYIVYVFYTPTVGCGPFETELVEVQVTRDGYVREISRTPVYRDPSQDSLCRD